MGAPTALDIALWQVPTKQLDKVYGGDPWSMMNRGVLNELEKQILEAEAIEGARIQKSYDHEGYLERNRRLGINVDNDRTYIVKDKSLEGNNRVSYKYGKLTLNLSTIKEGANGIYSFVTYSGDVSMYEKTE